MFHPTRGGTRGGKDQFSWESVKTDKDRECYLGHSLMAPVGRWQQGKDIQWYAHDKDGKKKLNDEFTKAKEMEEKALMAALGYKVVDKPKHIETPEKDESYSKRSQREEKESSSSSSSKSLGLKDTDYLDKMLIKFLDKYGFDQVIDALKIDDDKSKKKKKKKDKKHHKSSKKSKKSSRSSDEDSSSDSDENDHRKRDSNKRKDKSKSHNGGSSNKKSRHSSSSSESSNTSSESD